MPLKRGSSSKTVSSNGKAGKSKKKKPGYKK